MKQGKGVFLCGGTCVECGARIEQGTAEQPTYWAWETHNYYDYRGYNEERVYYHRSCARRVGKRREAERAQQRERGA